MRSRCFSEYSAVIPIRLLLVTVLLVTASGCTHEADPDPTVAEHQSTEFVAETNWPSDARGDENFTGSAKCVECHNGIAERYFGSHPMGSSVRYPDDFGRELEQSLPMEFDSGNRHYSVSMNDGVITQTERMKQGNQVLYEQSCNVDFAIGSGTRGYSFVTVRDGGLFQAPVTWYSQKQKWDLSPGYDPHDHPRFERRMSDGCIFCHAGRANRADGAMTRFGNPVFHEGVIGCERCHGPGAQHAEFHSAANNGENDTIVNPAKLIPARRDSICYQCHLHGRDRILRTARGEYDFRPGDRLSDVWVAFVNQPATTESAQSFKAVSQVEQMVASRCYTLTNGKLGCISCHDPHGTPSAQERVDFYRARCVKCHDSSNGCSEPLQKRRKTSPQDSCIQCHMPPSGASDVPHTAQTDHRVLRSYDEAAVSGADAAKSRFNIGVFSPETQPLPQVAIQRAFALKTAQRADNRSSAAKAMNALAPFVDESSDDEPVLSAATWLLIYLGDLKGAQRLGMRALNLQRQNDSTREALTVIAQAQGNYEVALQNIDDLLQLTPFSSTFLARRAEILALMGREEESAESWRDSLKVNPLLHVSREGLINVISDSDSDEAARQSELLKVLKELQQRRDK